MVRIKGIWLRKKVPFVKIKELRLSQE